MLRIEVITIFPRMVEAAVSDGIVGRARDAGLVQIGVHDLRDFSDDDRHRSVDDAPFGGGPGMVMKAEPFFRAKDALFPEVAPRDAVVLLSPRGRRFDQRVAERYAGLDRLVFLCGRYEGITSGCGRGGDRGAVDFSSPAGKRPRSRSSRLRCAWCPALSGTMLPPRKTPSPTASWTPRTTRGPRLFASGPQVGAACDRGRA
jgi:hypothetical protein